MSGGEGGEKVWTSVLPQWQMRFTVCQWTFVNVR